MLGAVTRRKRALEELELRRGRSSTYTDPLCEGGDDLKAFLSEFYKKIYQPNMLQVKQDALDKYSESLGMHYQILVPNVVKETDFWLRYFYRCDLDRISRELAEKDAIESKKQVQKSVTMINNLFSPQKLEKARKKSTESLRARRSPSPKEASHNPPLPAIKTSLETTEKIQSPRVSPQLSTDSWQPIEPETAASSDSPMPFDEARGSNPTDKPSSGALLVVLGTAFALLVVLLTSGPFAGTLCAPVHPGTRFDASTTPAMIILSPWWAPESLKERLQGTLCPNAVSVEWIPGPKNAKLSFTRGSEKLLEVKGVLTVDISLQDIKVFRKQKEESLPLPWLA